MRALTESARPDRGCHDQEEAEYQPFYTDVCRHCRHLKGPEEENCPAVAAMLLIHVRLDEQEEFGSHANTPEQTRCQCSRQDFVRQRPAEDGVSLQ